MAGFIDTIKSWFSSEKGLRSSSRNIQISLRGTRYSGGQNRRQAHEILDTYKHNPDLRKVVDIIAQTGSTADVNVLRNGEEDDTHELNQILMRPNKWQTQRDFLKLCYIYLDLVGEFWIVKREGMRGPNLFCLPPTKVFQHERNRLLFDAAVELNTTNHQDVMDSDEGVVMNAKLGEDIVRINIEDPEHPYTDSLGWGQTLGAELDISEFAATHEATYLKNHAIKDIILNIPGLDNQQQKQLKELWARQSGPDNSGKPKFLNLKDIEVIEQQGEFKPGSMIELRKHSADVIREAFGVPAEVLGDNVTSTRATAKVADYLFKKNVVQPRINFLLDQISMRVVPMLYDRDESRSLMVDAPSIVPKDREFILNLLKAAKETFTINEARELRDADPIEGGDVLLAEQSQQEAVEAIFSDKPSRTKSLHRDKPKIHCGLNGSYSEKLSTVAGRIASELEEDKPSWKQ